MIGGKAMDVRTRTELELILKRLDIIRIELASITDRERDGLDGMSELDPVSHEVMDQERVVECLEEAETCFGKALECLSAATD